MREAGVKEGPREKLDDFGESSLSDDELLAIIIGTGTKGHSSLQIAKTLLEMADNSLRKLANISIRNMMDVPGVGMAKAVTIKAALELSRRQGPDAPEKIVTSLDAYNALRIDLADLDHEQFWVLLLNRRSKLILKKRISQGGISGTVVDPRIIFKLALDERASTIIAAHNHPSGNLKPSQADLDITRKLVAGGKFFDIQVVDHLILAGKNYCSFADSGLL